MKRTELRLLLMLLTTVMWVSAYGETGKNAKIAVVSDIHVMAPSLLEKGAESQDAWKNHYAGQRKMLQESADIFTQFVDEMKDSKPDVLLVTGDLTKDGEEVSHEYVRDGLKSLTDNGIKVLVIPGNHDFGAEGNHKQFNADGTTEDVAVLTTGQFAEFYKGYGYGDANSQYDANSLSYVAEPVEGLVVLAIDSHSASISDETLDWVCNKAAEARKAGKQVVAMMHHPLFPHITGANMFISTYTVNSYETVRDALVGAGVNVILTGHFHTSDIAKDWKDDETKAIYDINTGSLISYPCDYRMLTVSADRMTLNVETESIVPEGMTAGECKAWLKGRVMGVVKATIEAKINSLSGWMAMAAKAMATEEVKDEFASFGGDLFILHAEGDEYRSANRAALETTYGKIKENYGLLLDYAGLDDASIYSILDDKSYYGEVKENQTDDRKLSISLPPFEVTTAASGFTTLVSTASLDVTAVEGLTAYIATYVDKDAKQVTLKRIGVVPANTPVVLKGAASTTYQLNSLTTSATAPAENLLKGSATASTELAAGEAYILSGGKFHKNNEGTMPAGKAYLPATAVGSAPQLTIIFDDGQTTAIKDVRANSQLPIANSQYYDLSGRKLNGMPNQKGLYINNGKVYVIK